VGVSVASIGFSGDRARVRVTRREVKDGKTSQSQQTLLLVKQGASWVIQQITR
jgi:hypothetical protein